MPMPSWYCHQHPACCLAVAPTVTSVRARIPHARPARLLACGFCIPRLLPLRFRVHQLLRVASALTRYPELPCSRMAPSLSLRPCPLHRLGTSPRLCSEAKSSGRCTPKTSQLISCSPELEL